MRHFSMIADRDAQFSSERSVIERAARDVNVRGSDAMGNTRNERNDGLYQQIRRQWTPSCGGLSEF